LKAPFPLLGTGIRTPSFPPVSSPYPSFLADSRNRVLLQTREVPSPAIDHRPSNFLPPSQPPAVEILTDSARSAREGIPVGSATSASQEITLSRCLFSLLSPFSVLLLSSKSASFPPPQFAKPLCTPNYFPRSPLFDLWNHANPRLRFIHPCSPLWS